MYHLIWSDYDGHYVEQYKDKVEFAKKLLELSRKEKDNNYGTKIIVVIEGATVHYEYVIDETNSVEKIRIDDELMITNKLPPLKDRIEVDCPVCGNDAGLLDEYIAKINGKEESLILYGCSECGKRFYIGEQKS